MKKIIVILMVLFAVGIQATAQVDYSFGNMKKSRKLKTNPSVGIKGGLTFYNMKFSDANYDKLSGERVIKPGFGAFVEIPFGKRGMSIGAELMMIERGMKKSFNHLGVEEVNSINSKYIDFRIPLTYYLLLSDYINPYMFVAADAAFCYGGTAQTSFPNGEYSSSSVDIATSDAVLTQYDLSAIVGVGVRFNVMFELFTMAVKLDASYNFGILNIKSQVEGTPTNVYAHSSKDDATWHNRGIEIMLGVSIPLKWNRMHDSCWGW